jgi:hypothetical protein
MGIIWRQQLTEAIDLRAYAAEVRAAVRQTMTESALAMEADAKAHAPWTDDTGLARAGLTATVDVLPFGAAARITLAHSMEYGQWLESRWAKTVPPEALDTWALEFEEAGKYAILWPTIERELPQLAAALQAQLDG